MTTAKIIWSGDSQTVELPKEFRFDAPEVTITRDGDKVVLEPAKTDWTWLKELQALGPLDDDFLAALDEEAPQPERSELDDLFE